MRAVEKVSCVVLRHTAQLTGSGRIGSRINVVEVGCNDRGFVGPELCQYSSGLSGKVFFGFVDVGRRSVDEAIVRYCQ